MREAIWHKDHLEQNDKAEPARNEPSQPLLSRLLKAAGLRPTRQRLALADLLFGTDGKAAHRHITAERLQEEARAAGIRVSLATIYNTLHQFTRAGLLHEITIHAGRSYFDTNHAPHYHFYCEKSGTLVDIPADKLPLAALPSPPEPYRIKSVDVVIRLEKASDENDLE